MRRLSLCTNCAAPEITGPELLVGVRIINPDNSLGGFMRSVLLWAVGIPLPIILIIWLISGHA